MGAIHNDLATWVGKARARGQDTISLDIETADMISDLILEYQEKLDNIKNFVEEMESTIRAIHGTQLGYTYGYIDALNVLRSKMNAIMV